MSRSLTLFLPHDLTAVRQRLPALEALLARGERRCDQPADGPRRLLQLCGVAEEPQMELPLGPLCALGDGLAASEGYWLCAEPVHLLADQDKVYLAARAADLAITAEEAMALTADFNTLFHDDGWQLLAPSPARWYLRLPQILDISTTAPDHSVGCDVRRLLPRGADSMRLLAALSEIQMLFHASVVNACRTVDGRPAINSLWLWGGAVLPKITSLPWRRLQGEGPLLRGITLQGDARCVAVDDTAEAWLADDADGLVLFDEEQHSLAQLEHSWFAPLLAAVRRGSLVHLNIHLTTTPCSYRLDRRLAKRWWRRRRAVSICVVNG